MIIMPQWSNAILGFYENITCSSLFSTCVQERILTIPTTSKYDDCSARLNIGIELDELIKEMMLFASS